MIVRDFNPADGMAFQGDVAIVPVPVKLAASLNPAEEISPRDGRLILAEGEISGHHHAITLPPRSAEADSLMADALANKIAVPTARLYRDPAMAEAMLKAGILTRTDLCIAFLEIDGGPFTVTHEEHDGIRLPPGLYYIGNQVESAGAEERRVAD
jgi:hypothetical protein